MAYLKHKQAKMSIFFCFISSAYKVIKSLKITNIAGYNVPHRKISGITKFLQIYDWFALKKI